MTTNVMTIPSVEMDEFSADLVVRDRSTPSEGVVLLDLAHPEKDVLPRWEPGAHIDLLLADGLTRQYSLCGDPADLEMWRVGILLDPNTRGGSRLVHEQLHRGATVRVRGPRNNFSLVESSRYRFIAGGIGITPIVAMIEAAEQAGHDWTLLYGGRTRASMAFAADLTARYGDRVTVWPQDERGLLDLENLLKQPEDDTLLYCCGSEPLLAAVEQHSAHWPTGRLHIERFAAKTLTDAPSDDEAAELEVVCQRSGITVEVAPGSSILDTLEDAGAPIIASCREGVCGTCEVRVLEGTPDHRDSVLSDAEQAAGEVMMVCVSRARTNRLVLDL
ncbi:PDR/VanB family oxidoreductase [Rhodococcus sp. USK13]|uniref:PDR/VanB family oxidoreductase n=1 Tax=Rhodococcus sp. USK13 TaxID=2806442 RepID=UPI001BCE1175|nr:PDR/VanB family oxidoreductase [Rhodococcus sp. USK13]